LFSAVVLQDSKLFLRVRIPEAQTRISERVASRDGPPTGVKAPLLMTPEFSQYNGLPIASKTPCLFEPTGIPVARPTIPRHPGMLMPTLRNLVTVKK
jgi:hypothetical protein